jgi:hypothetical protein
MSSLANSGLMLTRAAEEMADAASGDESPNERRSQDAARLERVFTTIADRAAHLATFIDGYARPGSARDREVELPAGAIRTVDVQDTEGLLVTPPETVGGRQVGSVRLVVNATALLPRPRSTGTGHWPARC